MVKKSQRNCRNWLLQMEKIIIGNNSKIRATDLSKLSSSFFFCRLKNKVHYDADNKN